MNTKKMGNFLREGLINPDAPPVTSVVSVAQFFGAADPSQYNYGAIRLKSEPQSPDILPIPDDEAANIVTHAIGIAVAVVGLFTMMFLVSKQSWGIAFCCIVYSLSVVSVFAFSTLSHAVYQPRLRNRMRAWDQGMIYAMIAGTYTPFTWAYGGDFRIPLLIFMWSFAAIGFWSKVIAQHRVNSMATTTYLVLGWFPALVLGPQVSSACLLAMAAGGILYSVGVFFLVFDNRVRYFHAVWHLLVIAAASIHYAAVLQFVLWPLMPSLGS